jgi:hypothetical protein
MEEAAVASEETSLLFASLMTVFSSRLAT